VPDALTRQPLDARPSWPRRVDGRDFDMMEEYMDGHAQILVQSIGGSWCVKRPSDISPDDHLWCPTPSHFLWSGQQLVVMANPGDAIPGIESDIPSIDSLVASITRIQEALQPVVDIHLALQAGRRSTACWSFPGAPSDAPEREPREVVTRLAAAAALKRFAEMALAFRGEAVPRTWGNRELDEWAAEARDLAEVLNPSPCVQDVTPTGENHG
jgi:hypothetical protein